MTSARPDSLPTRSPPWARPGFKAPSRWELLFCEPLNQAPLASRLAWARGIHQTEQERAPFDRGRAGPALLAARSGDWEMMEGLARLGVSFEPGVGRRSKAPLFEAMRTPNPTARARAVEALLRHGVNPRPIAKRASAVSFALARDDADSLEAMARAGVDFNDPALWDQGLSPLSQALHRARRPKSAALRMVRALLKGGASPNPAVEGARAPLALAASRGALECVQELVLAGADLEARAPDGRDALDCALLDARYGDERSGQTALWLIQRLPPERARRQELIESLSLESQEFAEGFLPALRALEALEQADALAQAAGVSRAPEGSPSKPRGPRAL